MTLAVTRRRIALPGPSAREKGRIEKRGKIGPPHLLEVGLLVLLDLGHADVSFLLDALDRGLFLGLELGLLVVEEGLDFGVGGELALGLVVDPLELCRQLGLRGLLCLQVRFRLGFAGICGFCLVSKFRLALQHLDFLLHPGFLQCRLALLFESSLTPLRSNDLLLLLDRLCMPVNFLNLFLSSSIQQCLCPRCKSRNGGLLFVLQCFLIHRMPSESHYITVD